MTETALMADIVLPATMFLEHDDLYQGGGHQYIMLGPKLIDPPGECRSNHEVICALAKRVGAEHPRLRHEPARDHRLDAAEVRLGHARRARGEAVDRLPAATSTRRTTSTASPIRTGKFRFKPDWTTVPSRNAGAVGPVGDDAGAARPLGR